MIISKKNLILAAFVVLWCSFAPGPGDVSNASSEHRPRLGVWITVFSPEEVLYSKENVDRLIRICEKSGISDIYIQVYRADRAYYDSRITDREPYEKILSRAGEDTLVCLIEKATGSGLDVHAWVNLLSIARNTDAGILKKLGGDVIALDQYGRSSLKEGEGDDLDRYYIRENQLFLEPGDERVRRYLADIVEEIARKYPGLSGLHFDYVRYPTVAPFVPGSRFTSHGISYGYGENNVTSFKAATGLDPNTMEHSRENFRLWDDWRRKQVSALVREVSGRVRAASPEMKISCTIVPSIERTYLSTLQNWTRWLREGYIDYVVAMNYTDDTNLMELRSGSLLLQGLKQKVHIGIGAYLMKDNPEALKSQLRSLQNLSPKGIVIFSYDDIAASEEIQDFLAKSS